MRLGRQFTDLEQELLAQQAKAEADAEREAFRLLQERWYHLDEYQALQFAAEDVLDAYELYGEESDEVREANEHATKAWNAFVTEALKREREEQENGKAQNQDETAGR